jgi:teichuronic acid biosynthesis glycosyltransferase TuaG
MTETKPTISIIMPAYNSSRTIVESIDSVLAQTFNSWELLITDDCSTDSTMEIVERKIQGDPRIKLFRLEQNSGAGAARNHSIKEAKGNYIAFLDADDLWVPTKLQIQLDYMQSHSYDFTFSAYQTISAEGELGKVYNPPAVATRERLLYSNVIGCLTAMYNAKTLGKRYMSTIRKRQDFHLWLEILQVCKEAYCIPEVLAYYRIGNSSLSSNKFKVLSYQWELYRSVLGLGVLRSTWYFIWYILFGIIKRI